MKPPLVGVIMGSKSDFETMRHAKETLEALEITHEVRVVSAHRTPDRMVEYARGAAARETERARERGGVTPLMNHICTDVSLIHCGVYRTASAPKRKSRGH